MFRVPALLGAIAGLLLWPGPAAAGDDVLVLADPSAPLEDAWRHRVFDEFTDYTGVTIDGRPAIRAVGRGSASGLYRDVAYLVNRLPWLEWSWRVERLQAGADIRVKETQDFAASLFLVFGKPGITDPEVPILAYVWANGDLPTGAVVDCPLQPDTMKLVVVRGGDARLGRWTSERRNVVADFKRAFGTDPPATLETIALFTDNDQTKQPVEAYYGAVRALSKQQRN